MEPPTDEELEAQIEKGMTENVKKDRNATPEELPRAQMMLGQRLIVEIDDLRESIDSYRYWSKRLTLALVSLSLALLIVASAQLYVALT